MEISSVFVSFVPELHAEHDGLSTLLKLAIIVSALIVLSIVNHIGSQILPKASDKPPVVFSWLPFLGSTIEYGTEPYKFFFKNQAKLGNCFTFTLVGKKHTVCLGPEGNDFVLNGKLQHVSAADIYKDLTVATFGPDVCYDAPPAKLMEQKKMCKYSLTADKLNSYVPIITEEVHKFINSHKSFQGQKGSFDVVETVGVVSIFTATRTLQGKEVRQSFDAELADLYHDLDMSFIPINFFMPWLPIPVNKRRDRAQQKIAAIYESIIATRRNMSEAEKAEVEDDMISNLMRSKYSDGKSVPDHEIAHILIAMLMAGQHTSSSIGAWVLLRLAMRPDIQEALYEEQKRVLGEDLPLPQRDDINKLHLVRLVIRETLRLHIPIHSIMRLAKSDLTIRTKSSDNQDKIYTVPKGHVLVSAPGVTAQTEEYFPNASEWDPYRWHSMKDFLDGEEKTTELGYGPMSKSAASTYLPFGAGRHRCIGEHFAYLQLGTIICLLTREFKFKNPAGHPQLAPTDYESMFTRPIVPTYLEWERRTAKPGMKRTVSFAASV